MRKILIIVIIILLGLLGYTSIANGIQIGDLEIYSMAKIQEKNNEINSEIENINNLRDTEYPKKLKELNTASSNMSTARSKYLEYTSLSSDSDILAAMQGRSYKIEFLWAKLGTHARNEEINLKLEIASSSIGATNTNDLKFTVNGTYINIINFVYAIENDADLSFKISNFKLLPYDENGILEGTFVVTNITIEENKESSTSNNTLRSNNASTVTTTVNTSVEQNNTDSNASSVGRENPMSASDGTTNATQTETQKAAGKQI